MYNAVLLDRNKYLSQTKMVEINYEANGYFLYLFHPSNKPLYLFSESLFTLLLLTLYCD